MKEKKYNPIAEAYKILLEIQDNKEATSDDAFIAIEEAIGYLGEALDD